MEQPPIDAERDVIHPRRVPPIGIEPQYMWKTHRVHHLQEAIARYVNGGFYWPCVAEWAREIAELIEEMNKEKEGL